MKITDKTIVKAPADRDPRTRSEKDRVECDVETPG